MKRTVFTGILFAISAMLLIISCSDDDSGTPPDQGNLDDPVFVFMDDFLGSGMNNINFLTIDHMSYMIDSVVDNEVSKQIPQLAGKAQFNIHYIPGGYTEENNWYVFDDSLYITPTSSDEPDSIFYSGTDSLGFYGGGALIAPPNLETIDSLGLHNSGTYNIYADNTHLQMTYSTDYTITAQAFGVNPITIDGTAEFTATGVIEFESGDLCDMTMDITLTYTDLDIDASDEVVPMEGTASATAVITQSCETGSTAPDISGTWTVSWVLSGGSVTNTYTRGDDTWVYTESLDD